MSVKTNISSYEFLVCRVVSKPENAPVFSSVAQRIEQTASKFWHRLLVKVYYVVSLE